MHAARDATVDCQPLNEARHLGAACPIRSGCESLQEFRTVIGILEVFEGRQKCATYEMCAAFSKRINKKSGGLSYAVSFIIAAYIYACLTQFT